MKELCCAVGIAASIIFLTYAALRDDLHSGATWPEVPPKPAPDHTHLLGLWTNLEGKRVTLVSDRGSSWCARIMSDDYSNWDGETGETVRIAQHLQMAGFRQHG